MVFKCNMLSQYYSSLLYFLLDLILHFLRLQLLHSEQGDSQLVLSGEGLGHPLQPLPADLDGLLGGEVDHAVLQVLLDPLGQLPPLILPAEPLVGQDHDPVISLASQDPPDTLSRVSHGVEGEEVVL